MLKILTKIIEKQLINDYEYTNKWITNLMIINMKWIKEIIIWINQSINK